MNPVGLAQKARATRRALAGAPVPKGWVGDALKTQLRLATGRVRRENGVVQVPVGKFEVAGFSVSSLEYLHRKIFVELEYWFRARRREPFIIDGGSNIGMSVLFFKTLYPDARVLAFEPAQRAHELLVRNVEANGLRAVDVHRVALGLENGTVPFFEDPNDPATFRMSTRAGRITGTSTSVTQQRLSDLLAGEVDLLKLDVEGAEDGVLADLCASGAISRIEQLVVEYHHQLDVQRDFLGAFLEQLREHGFAYQISAAENIRLRAADEPAFQDVIVYARGKELSR